MTNKEIKQIKKAVNTISDIHSNKVNYLLPDKINQLMVDYLYEVMKHVGHDDFETYIDEAINWDLEFDK